MRRARIEYVVEGSSIIGTVTFPGRPPQRFNSADELERCLGRGAGGLVLVDATHHEPDDDADLAALSATEQAIAQRAAAGASNREIADAMYYSVKSVEAYLTRIYRRLGIEGREGLHGIVQADDLAPQEPDHHLVHGGAATGGGSVGVATGDAGPPAVVVELFVT
jgi:DNA-binding CsgD family transcriptional regulator